MLKKLLAITLLLFSFSFSSELKNKEERLRCAVCGMYTDMYPRWFSQIIYKNKNSKEIYTFESMKDLLKFYYNPKKWGDYNLNKEDIISIEATDYKHEKRINAKKAYFVIGSEVLGPMGNEFIAFLNKEDAKEFKEKYQGKKILKFEEIKELDVYNLDK